MQSVKNTIRSYLSRISYINATDNPISLNMKQLGVSVVDRQPGGNIRPACFVGYIISCSYFVNEGWSFLLGGLCCLHPVRFMLVGSLNARRR